MNFRDPACWAVPDAEEDEFWWMPGNQTALVKISVLGNDDEAVLTCERPDKSVIGAGKVVRFDVGRSGVKVFHPLNDSIGQVFVKQKLHAAVEKSLRSRSAAKARHALISSRVNSEKSASISSSVIPEARYSRTS